jgi:hypothetical protein
MTSLGVARLCVLLIGVLLMLAFAWEFMVLFWAAFGLQVK